MDSDVIWGIWSCWVFFQELCCPVFIYPVQVNSFLFNERVHLLLWLGFEKVFSQGVPSCSQEPVCQRKHRREHRGSTRVTFHSHVFGTNKVVNSKSLQCFKVALLLKDCWHDRTTSLNTLFIAIYPFHVLHTGCIKSKQCNTLFVQHIWKVYPKILSRVSGINHKRTLSVVQMQSYNWLALCVLSGTFLYGFYCCLQKFH